MLTLEIRIRPKFFVKMKTTTRAFRMDHVVVKIISTSCKTKFFLFLCVWKFYFKIILEAWGISRLILHWESAKLSATLVNSFNVKKKFQKGSRTFFILFSDDDFSEVFFWNYWNISLGLEKNFILCMWWLVDGSMVFVLYENWNECFQKSKNSSSRTFLKGITSVARTFFFEATWWKNCFDFLLNTLKKNDIYLSDFKLIENSNDIWFYRFLNQSFIFLKKL